MHLSELLGKQLLSQTGESIGRLDDLIVRLREADYPLVTGLVAKVGNRRVFLPIDRVASFEAAQISLRESKVDLRTFERRPGEVLLRTDILGHRLIDVTEADLVRAWDLELQATGEGWVLHCLDTRRPARFLGLLRQGAGHPCQDWRSFEPLIGHTPSMIARSGFRRLRRLKPAQIADLLEDASRHEGEEILDAVHADPELEADVFEELDPDVANRLFGDKSDAEVADVLAHMRADDAADTIAELRQDRRQRVLDLLPAGTRTKVLSLMGFNATSAGGLMGVEFLAAPVGATVEEALRRLRISASVQPEASVTVHALDDHDHLAGVASVIELLRNDPDCILADIMDRDFVRVSPATDAVDVALLMSDYNLMTIPVVDADGALLGVITVDDILEVAIPDDWRRREPAARPDAPTEPTEHLDARR